MDIENKKKLERLERELKFEVGPLRIRELKKAIKAIKEEINNHK